VTLQRADREDDARAVSGGPDDHVLRPGRTVHEVPLPQRQNGTFEGLDVNDVTLPGVGRTVGLRMCPKPDCRAVIYVVREGGTVFFTEPREVIDFDVTDIPEPVTSALQEAITCHANACYRAAAIMVRRTLEELCAEKGATGQTLADRIKALGSVVIIAPALLEGIDEIRIFGNDAAHLEARVYDEIGSNEVEVVIDFTKEVLKAVYQTETLLQRLKGIRPTPT